MREFRTPAGCTRVISDLREASRAEAVALGARCGRGLKDAEADSALEFLVHGLDHEDLLIMAHHARARWGAKDSS